MAYRAIYDTLWTDPKIRTLSPKTKLLFIYLITNPHAHYSGIYYLPKEIIEAETGLSGDDIQEGFDTLSGGYLCRVDRVLGVVWVVKMARYQAKSEKQIIGIANHFKELHNCPLIKEFMEFYADLTIPYELKTDTPPIPYQGSIARERERERDKEREQDRDLKGGAATQSTGRPRTENQKANDALNEEALAIFEDETWKPKISSVAIARKTLDGNQKWLLEVCGDVYGKKSGEGDPSAILIAFARQEKKSPRLKPEEEQVTYKISDNLKHLEKQAAKDDIEHAEWRKQQQLKRTQNTQG